MSVQAQKGNKILRISEDAVERYLGMGYNIVGSDGAVLKKAVPSDNNQLKLEYAQNMREIEDLKAEIVALNEKNALLKQENKRLAKELADAKAVPEKPTRKRKQNVEKAEEKVVEEQPEEQVVEVTEESAE